MQGEAIIMRTIACRNRASNARCMKPSMRSDMTTLELLELFWKIHWDRDSVQWPSPASGSLIYPSGSHHSSKEVIDVKADRLESLPGDPAFRRRE
jgi:hypothetical protein